MTYEVSNERIAMLNDLERAALLQAEAHRVMLVLNGGVGKLGVEHPTRFEDMLHWQDISKDDHADTVLVLLEYIRELHAALGSEER